ncbi:DUF3592 domain-containing protein [Deinococcus malanensis]|nr:DUF3592 domain-containing protein [Deinococcus malanensis]
MTLLALMLLPFALAGFACLVVGTVMLYRSTLGQPGGSNLWPTADAVVIGHKFRKWINSRDHNFLTYFAQVGTLVRFTAEGREVTAEVVPEPLMKISVIRPNSSFGTVKLSQQRLEKQAMQQAGLLVPEGSTVQVRYKPASLKQVGREVVHSAHAHISKQQAIRLSLFLLLFGTLTLVMVASPMFQFLKYR